MDSLYTLHICMLASVDADLPVDLPIVETALECVQSSYILVIDDTYLLILLCHHNNLQSQCSIYLKSEPKKDSNKLRIWNIKYTPEKLGIDIYMWKYTSATCYHGM